MASTVESRMIFGECGESAELKLDEVSPFRYQVWASRTDECSPTIYGSQLTRLEAVEAFERAAVELEANLNRRRESYRASLRASGKLF